MATILTEIESTVFTAAPADEAFPLTEPSLLVRLRKFLWVWSGMFSVACLALAFTGFAALGAFEAAASNFLGAVVSGGLFGVASLLRFGPDSD